MKNLKIKLYSLSKNESVLTLFLRITGVAFIFITTYFFTKCFPSQIVGLYDFNRAYLLIIGSVCMLSLDQTILYFLGKYGCNKTSLFDIYKKIACIIIILFLSINVLFFILLKLISFELSTITKVILIKSNFILFFYCIYLINVEIYRGLNYPILSEIFRNVVKYIPLLIGFYFVKNNNHLILDYFIFGFIIIAIISFLLLFILSNKCLNENHTYQNISIFHIIKTSFPIMLSTIFLYLLSGIDIFFIKYFSGDSAVAYFALSVKIVSIINVGINAIGLSKASKISSLYAENNKEELAKIIYQLNKLIFIFTIFVSVFIFLLNKPILTFFGEEYLKAKSALFILLIGNFIFSFFGNTYIYFIMTNKGKILSYILFFAVIMNLFLNIFLIPKIGINGAAISSIVSILFWNIIGSFITYRKDRLKIFFNFIK